MVGKALNELYGGEAVSSGSMGSNARNIRVIHTSFWLPLAPSFLWEHSLWRSAKLRVAYKDVRSETLTGCAELTPVMCRPRRRQGVAACC